MSGEHFIERALLYHRHAPVAALMLALVSVIVSAAAMVTDIPDLAGSLLLGVSLLWIVAGAMVGWIPRP